MDPELIALAQTMDPRAFRALLERQKEEEQKKYSQQKQEPNLLEQAMNLAALGALGYGGYRAVNAQRTRDQINRATGQTPRFMPTFLSPGSQRDRIQALSNELANAPDPVTRAALIQELNDLAIAVDPQLANQPIAPSGTGQAQQIETGQPQPDPHYDDNPGWSNEVTPDTGMVAYQQRVDDVLTQQIGSNITPEMQREMEALSRSVGNVPVEQALRNMDRLEQLKAQSMGQPVPTGQSVPPAQSMGQPVSSVPSTPSAQSPQRISNDVQYISTPDGGEIASLYADRDAVISTVEIANRLLADPSVLPGGAGQAQQIETVKAALRAATQKNDAAEVAYHTKRLAAAMDLKQEDLLNLTQQRKQGAQSMGQPVSSVPSTPSAQSPHFQPGQTNPTNPNNSSQTNPAPSSQVSPAPSPMGGVDPGVIQASALLSALPQVSSAPPPLDPAAPTQLVGEGNSTGYRPDAEAMLNAIASEASPVDNLDPQVVAKAVDQIAQTADPRTRSGIQASANRLIQAPDPTAQATGLVAKTVINPNSVLPQVQAQTTTGETTNMQNTVSLANPVDLAAEEMIRIIAQPEVQQQDASGSYRPVTPEQVPPTRPTRPARSPFTPTYDRYLNSPRPDMPDLRFTNQPELGLTGYDIARAGMKSPTTLHSQYISLYDNADPATRDRIAHYMSSQRAKGEPLAPINESMLRATGFMPSPTDDRDYQSYLSRQVTRELINPDAPARFPTIIQSTLTETPAFEPLMRQASRDAMLLESNPFQSGNKRRLRVLTDRISQLPGNHPQRPALMAEADSLLDTINSYAEAQSQMPDDVFTQQGKAMAKIVGLDPTQYYYRDEPLKDGSVRRQWYLTGQGPGPDESFSRTAVSSVGGVKAINIARDLGVLDPLRPMSEVTALAPDQLAEIGLRTRHPYVMPIQDAVTGANRSSYTFYNPGSKTTTQFMGRFVDPGTGQIVQAHETPTNYLPGLAESIEQVMVRAESPYDNPEPGPFRTGRRSDVGRQGQMTLDEAARYFNTLKPSLTPDEARQAFTALPPATKQRLFQEIVPVGEQAINTTDQSEALGGRPALTSTINSAIDALDPWLDRGLLQREVWDENYYPLPDITGKQLDIDGTLPAPSGKYPMASQSSVFANTQNLTPEQVAQVVASSTTIPVQNLTRDLADPARQPVTLATRLDAPLSADLALGQLNQKLVAAGRLDALSRVMPKLQLTGDADGTFYVSPSDLNPAPVASPNAWNQYLAPPKGSVTPLAGDVLGRDEVISSILDPDFLSTVGPYIDPGELGFRHLQEPLKKLAVIRDSSNDVVLGQQPLSSLVPESDPDAPLLRQLADTGLELTSLGEVRNADGSRRQVMRIKNPYHNPDRYAQTLQAIETNRQANVGVPVTTSRLNRFSDAEPRPTPDLDSQAVVESVIENINQGIAPEQNRVLAQFPLSDAAIQTDIAAAQAREARKREASNLIMDAIAQGKDAYVPGAQPNPTVEQAAAMQAGFDEIQARRAQERQAQQEQAVASRAVFDENRERAIANAFAAKTGANPDAVYAARRIAANKGLLADVAPPSPPSASVLSAGSTRTEMPLGVSIADELQARGIRVPLPAPPSPEQIASQISASAAGLSGEWQPKTAPRSPEMMERMMQDIAESKARRSQLEQMRRANQLRRLGR